MDTFLDAEDLQGGLESGVPGSWWVYKDYMLERGNITGIGLISEASRLYRPILEKELPSVLAKVDPEDEEQIFDFVRRYGLLGGYPGNLVESPQGPEPLEWIQLQIRSVRFVLDMQEALSRNEVGAIERLYTQYDRTTNTFAGIPIPQLLNRTDTLDVPSGLTSNAPTGWLRFLSCAIVNSHVGNVTRKATMRTDGSGTTSYFFFSCLLDVVYWHILNEMDGGEFKKCEACNAPFISTDKRQRFCPKRYGEDESRCAAKVRMRKHRNKYSEGETPTAVER